jgi:hypothetical protein
MDLSADRSTCAEFADDLGALAAGALTGRERAAVLVHVEHCPHCAVELESLSATADALLHLYPEIEPDEGFTDRVMDHIRGEARRSRRRPRMRVTMAAAAVVAVLGLAAGVTATTVSTGPTIASNVATASFHSSAGAVGRVTLTSDDRLVMTLDDRSMHGTVTCWVTLADGSHHVVGHFPLVGGYGTWRSPLPAPASSVRQVTVTNATGGVVASATIS